MIFKEILLILNFYYIVDKKLQKLYNLCMENIEFETLVLENQISFDFDGLEEKEESMIFTENLIKPLNHDYIKEEVLFVVVKAYNDDVAKNLPNIKLCGKKMIDWVLIAGSGCEQMVIDDCEDIIAKVRGIVTDKKYIAVFYSDTPLFDKASYFKLIDYFASKSMNFLQLSRGFIVKSDFLRNSPNFISCATGGNEMPSLFRCDSSAALSQIHQVLNERIIEYHIRNGVSIFGKSTVFIDADVEIDSGVIIYPNNILQGESVVSAGTILASGNIIDNSIILNDCHICGSIIKDSKLSMGLKIEFQKILSEAR